MPWLHPSHRLIVLLTMVGTALGCGRLGYESRAKPTEGSSARDGIAARDANAAGRGGSPASLDAAHMGDAHDGSRSYTDANSDAAACSSGDGSCSATHGASECLSGLCVITSCDSGWLDCDGDSTTGCETDIHNDPDNCGECGNECPSGHSCSSGTCVASDSCEGTTADCDGDADNGCETDLGDDPSNCGSCGNRCAGYEACCGGCCRRLEDCRPLVWCI